MWYKKTSNTPEPGRLQVEDGELSFYGNNNTANKYAKREIPNVSFAHPPDLIKLSFDFRQASGIDCDRFWFYFKDSESGAFIRVHYFERSRDLNIGQYSVENGYQNIYTDQNIDLRDGANCRFEIHFGMIYFYLDGVWKGGDNLDSHIDYLDCVQIALQEAHYHFDNVKITNSRTGTLLNLKFDDGPYAECADYVYNANDERIFTITTEDATYFYPFTSYIYDGNGKVLSEYKTNRYGSTSLKYNYLYGNGQKLQILDQICHLFRAKTAGHSGSNLPPIPDKSLPLTGSFPEFSK